MNLTEMERLQASNVRPVVVHASTIFAAHQAQAVTPMGWYQLLEMLFQIVFPASQRQAEIQRANYDWNRDRNGLPPHPIPLAELSLEQFFRDMEPVKAAMLAPETSPAQVQAAALRVARSIENSGRWTVMRATETPDPAFPDRLESDEVTIGQGRTRARGSNGVRGWARVATGAETCGWCWMLVSRGPVYRSASSAGSRLADRDSLQMVGSQEFNADEHMKQWHTGCDCKIVPVFNLENWDGRDRHLAAEELWKRTSKNANNNRDAINAFRRAVEAGEIQEILRRSRAA